MARKMTTEEKLAAKARQAEFAKNQAERAAAESLDSCEGATESERDRQARYMISHLVHDVAMKRDDWQSAWKEFAEKATREAKQAAEDCHPFYGGDYFARNAADLVKKEAEYKASLEKLDLFKKFFPDVKPVW